MATTEDAIVDRIRDVMTALGYTEAIGLDFTRLPVGTEDGAFTVGFEGDAPTGGIGLYEEARGTALVSVSRPVNDDYQTARRTCWQDARTIVSAVIRDGSVTSGEYAVEDGARRTVVEWPRGASYLIGRTRIPLNFEAML